MPDNPHKEIYGKDEAEAFVKEKLSKYTNFLQELANYGSNLIPRCYVSSPKSNTDVVLIASLLKHAVSMLDGVIVLLEKGAVFQAKLPLRSLFESLVHIKWILKEDTDRRATQYAVWHWRKRLDWTRVAIKGTEESKLLETAFKSKEKFNFVSSLEGHEIEAKSQEKQLVDLLNSPDFKEVNDAFELARARRDGKRSKRDSHWYSLFSGPKNLHELCVRLDMKGEYDIHYSDASETAHATTLMEMVSHQGDQIVFEQIRNVHRFDQIVGYGASLAIVTYRLILEKYRPGEAADNFPRKYRTEWQSIFMNIPKIVVEGGTIKII